ncbi:hypothetical protein BJV77DRAFT_1039463 [Russula vinacea]|nr:hypothetical protein BJV77DRAFT_1039463 [Russula vinacea]
MQTPSLRSRHSPTGKKGTGHGFPKTRRRLPGRKTGPTGNTVMRHSRTCGPALLRESRILR